MLAFLRGSTCPPRAALSAARARGSLILLVRSLGRALQYQLRQPPADPAGLLHFISSPVMAMVRVCSARFQVAKLLWSTFTFNLLSATCRSISRQWSPARLPRFLRRGSRAAIGGYLWQIAPSVEIDKAAILSEDQHAGRLGAEARSFLPVRHCGLGRDKHPCPDNILGRLRSSNTGKRKTRQRHRGQQGDANLVGAGKRAELKGSSRRCHTVA